MKEIGQVILTLIDLQNILEVDVIGVENTATVFRLTDRLNEEVSSLNSAILISLEKESREPQ